MFWKEYDLYFGAKTTKDIQQKDTIYILEPKPPKATIIRHGTIIRLLLVASISVHEVAWTKGMVQGQEAGVIENGTVRSWSGSGRCTEA